MSFDVPTFKEWDGEGLWSYSTWSGEYALAQTLLSKIIKISTYSSSGTTGIVAIVVYVLCKKKCAQTYGILFCFVSVLGKRRELGQIEPWRQTDR
jgi:hypothetical protein